MAPPVAFHRGTVRSDELRGDHALDFVFRPDPTERRHGGPVLPITYIFVGMHPKGLNRLIRNKGVPPVGLRSANLFQRALQVFGIVGHDRRGLVVGSRFLPAHC
jgi:hypothetical protein